MKVTLGVCAGRHEIPGVEKYVFDTFQTLPSSEELEKKAKEFFKEAFKGVNPGVVWWETYDDYTYTDMGKCYPDIDVDLYVTGFTPMVLAIIKVCQDFGYSVTCYHYDRDSGNYYPQRVLNHW